ncbi:MAG TPA: tRNA preQ1(34) S-adenosylmethionine ribosyltransferase-isomerase QueA [Steroidobacteraceae bacterium]|nr:tRNA preQ1(34) S-adenosylmethionine ribosyltransferase-isomerase QueA [Steroidobacteraceae bacterium]
MMHPDDLKRSDFDYPLPPELIAQTPLAERSASRLLLLDGARASWQDRQLRELPQLLTPGDLLVLNDTRVLPARLALRKPTGGRLELLLERPLTGRRALVQLRDSRAVRVGMALHSAGGAVRVAARCGQFWEVELPDEAVAFFEQHGQVPLPPYIERPADEADRERYQSLWARVPGAVAAPTASLHFDVPLLAALQARGIGRAFVTLHVGAGTFQPMRTEALSEHVMHPESYRVESATVELIERTRAAGRRVVAVGTTVARALEAAAAEAGSAGSAAPLAAAVGQTRLFIRPGYRFRVIDALLTNFHLPQSTLLMLVAAFAGSELVLSAYAHAVRERYRFFSYGDAMLVWPAASASGPARVTA